MAYKIKFLSKWADFDANKHMRHTAYNDYAAESRLRLFKDNGFDVLKFETYKIGPVLFSENTIFRKEIKLGESIEVELFLLAMSKNGERCKIYHKIYNEKGELSAEITVFLAWIDTEKRKLIKPPLEILSVFNRLDKAPNFEEIILKSK